jgi:hypothetical protein
LWKGKAAEVLAEFRVLSIVTAIAEAVSMRLIVWIYCSHKTFQYLPSIFRVQASRMVRLSARWLLRFPLSHLLAPLALLRLMMLFEQTGETISLGYYEQDDLLAVIEYLRNSGLVSAYSGKKPISISIPFSIPFWKYNSPLDLSNFLSRLQVSRIGLWGRSMGAATAVLVAARDPSIAGHNLDFQAIS